MERKIDALIEAGWRVLESDFDEKAFLHWRKRARECLEALLGPSHTYTEHFKYSMGQSEASTLLSGVGVLAAVALSGLHDAPPEKRRVSCDSNVPENIRSVPGKIMLGRKN